VKRLGAALAVLVIAVTGCSAPNLYDGYVHAECDATVDNRTECRVTQKPLPTVTHTVTPGATTPPASPDGIQAAEKFGWGPVLRGDEFNYTGAGHAGMGQRTAASWNVSNGVVRVTGDANGNTGGMAGLYNWGTQYMRLETRMRTNDRDPEYHPVLIVWPDANWTATSCPEIDYAEGMGNPAELGFNNHHPACGQGKWHLQPWDTTEWHNYAVEWGPAGVFGWIDGEPWFSDTSDQAKSMNMPMHDTIQLDWFPQDSPAANPQVSWMEVDWTRTYARP
jgi:hypothetical protein